MNVEHGLDETNNDGLKKPSNWREWIGASPVVKRKELSLPWGILLWRNIQDLWRSINEL